MRPRICPMEAPRQVTLGKLQDEVPGVFQGSRRSRELAWWRRQLLHPTVAAKVIGAFVRGEYDTAVFQAFKEVEVAVRAKGKFPDTEVGVPLMRRAFDPKPAHCVTPAWLKRSVRRPRIYLPARWGRSRTRTAIGMCPSPIRRKPLNCSSSPA